MTNNQLITLVNKVKSLLKGAPEPLHAFDHVERVARNTVKIAEILGLKKEIDINLLQAAGYLHDVPKALTYPDLKSSIKTNFFEAQLVKKMMPGILAKLDVDSKEKEVLFKATVNHPLSYPYRKLNKKGDVYTKILQDADTLDLFSPERMAMFDRYKKNHLAYRIIGRFTKLHTALGFKHLSWFLNYPELALHTGHIYGTKS